MSRRFLFIACLRPNDDGAQGDSGGGAGMPKAAKDRRRVPLVYQVERWALLNHIKFNWRIINLFIYQMNF